MTKEQLGSLILDSERQLYSTAKTILFSDYDCADAIQETIVKAFSNIGTLKNDNYARTWLIRILINECYSKELQRVVYSRKFLKRGTAFTCYSILHRRFQCKSNRPDP